MLHVTLWFFPIRCSLSFFLHSLYRSLSFAFASYTHKHTHILTYTKSDMIPTTMKRRRWLLQTTRSVFQLTLAPQHTNTRAFHQLYFYIYIQHYYLSYRNATAYTLSQLTNESFVLFERVHGVNMSLAAHSHSSETWQQCARFNTTTTTLIHFHRLRFIAVLERCPITPPLEVSSWFFEKISG